MRFLRVFAQFGLATNWVERDPPLPKVLKCFGINRAAQNLQPVSVFAVKSEREEMETVAALFQMTPSSPEKRFGIIIDEADCERAHIQMDRRQKGNTGIEKVDGRHVNLAGTQAQFGSLVVQIVKRMWEGEQRLRIYPAQQIAGQLAVFSRLPKGLINDDSRTNCISTIDQVSWHRFNDQDGCVEVRGKLHDSASYEVVASRPLASLGILDSIWKMFSGR